MTKRKLKPFVIPSLYVLAVVMFLLSMFFIQKSLSSSSFKEDEVLEYVDGSILDNDKSIPVVSTDVGILRPYTSSNVTVFKTYYDYLGDTESQKQAIVFYEGTYMQNSGIDYTSNELFDVVAILDGTVISVEESDILGTVVEIRHSNDIISVYQSLNNINVKAEDTVIQGQTIGQSGKSNLNTELQNCLHFELYYKGMVVNPEEYYDKLLKDL